MGEAKRRKQRQASDPTIYHHTSILRTNLLWMSGHVEVEGKSAMPAHHPQMGRVALPDATLRREVKDFPQVAWFTSLISIPKCLTDVPVAFIDNDTGAQRGEYDGGSDLINAMVLNRIAIGFRASDTPAVRWPEYFGYDTAEGRLLNESARDYGDDPDDWWVSETPVDLMLATEIWSSATIQRPRLERREAYLADMKSMVTVCRENPGTMIPPTWMKPEQAAEVARRLGVKIAPDR